MHILIAYATTEGQTARVAAYSADYLRAEGHDVTLLSLEDDTVAECDPFDAAILAGSVHIGRLQQTLTEFAHGNAQRLNAVPSLLVQVSLAAAGDVPEEMADLDRIASDFAQSTGWTPGRVLQVAGAMTMPDYNFVTAWMIRRIARAHGAEFDPDGVTEFTDWHALRQDLETWQAAL